MNTSQSKQQNAKTNLLTPLLIILMLLVGVTVNAQEHNEGKGHDKDAKNHAKNERKGHDKDKHVMRGEHRRDKGGDRRGEEAGTELKKYETYNVTKRGVKLILRYNKKSNSFEGTMTNVTNRMIKKARVEVHLSNGTELGPTIPVNLKAKSSKSVVLKATKKGFATWSTHAEVGGNEHGAKGRKEGHGKEGRGEHGSKKERKGEHN